MNVSRRNVAANNKKLIPLMLRLPEDMHEQVKRLAKEDRRSLNFQIVHLLEGVLGVDEQQEADKETSNG